MFQEPVLKKKKKKKSKPMHIIVTIVPGRPNYNLLLIEEYYNHEYSWIVLIVLRPTACSKNKRANTWECVNEYTPVNLVQFYKSILYEQQTKFRLYLCPRGVRM